MEHPIPTLKVVAGLTATLLGSFLWAASVRGDEYLIAGGIVVVGLALAANGLFTGIESAVAAGAGRAGGRGSADRVDRTTTDGD